MDFEFNDGDIFDSLQHDLVIDLDHPKLTLTEGERREVSVLFADVKGFTSMSSKLDPEVVHKRMDEIMRIFSKCVTFYGGFVDKYVGDCIMALFGAKVASEQDTERAVLTALKMSQQLALYNALLKTKPGFEDIQLGVRVGINTGLVSVGKVGEAREGDYTVYGNTVNLASRMESNAPVNRIMLAAETMRIVESRFEFEHLGPIRVKGIEKPVDCYLVLHPSHSTTKHIRPGKTTFIGRENELQTLRTVIDSASKPQGADSSELVYRDSAIVGISGDAGLGKSRLTVEFLRACEDEAFVLNGAASGVCASPLNLFANILENHFHLHRSQPNDVKARKLQSGIELLDRGLPEGIRENLRDSVPLLGFILEIPTQDQRTKQPGKELIGHLQQAVATFFEATSMQAAIQHKTLVVVLDDLHWLDSASAHVLNHLYQPGVSPSPRRITVILYRDEYKVAPVFQSHPAFSEIALKPMNKSETIRLIGQHASGMNLSQAILDRLYDLSYGNPFYLEEWCNYIQDLPLDNKVDLPIPSNLYALILSRLDRLHESVKILLQKAAVIGQEFFVEILGAIEQRLQNTTDVSSTLSNLEQQALVLKMLGFDYSSYFFKHITTREVAYKTLLVANRKILHQLTAEAIESIFAERTDEFLFELANHYLHTDIPDKALFYTKEAAQAAQNRFANQQALTLWKQYITLLEDDSGEQIAAMLKCAEINWLIGKWDEAEELIRKAKEVTPADDTANRFEACRQHGVILSMRGALDNARHEFNECLRIAGQLEDKKMLAISHGNLGILNQQLGNLDEARSYHERSLAFSKEIGDSLRQSKEYNNLGMLHMHRGEYNEAKGQFAASLQIAEINGYQQVQSHALGNLGFIAVKQGDADTANDFYQQKWRLVDKMGDQFERVKVLGNIGNLRRDAGDHREALHYYRQILAIKQTLGNTLEVARSYYNIGKQHYLLEEYPQAHEALDQSIDLAEGYPASVCQYYLVKGEVYVAQNNAASARETNRRATELAQAVQKETLLANCRSQLENIESMK